MHLTQLDEAELLITTHSDGSVVLWDIYSEDPAQIIANMDAPITGLSLSPRNRYIGVVYGHMTSVIDVLSGETSHSRRSSSIVAMQWTNAGENVVVDQAQGAQDLDCDKVVDQLDHTATLALKGFVLSEMASLSVTQFDVEGRVSRLVFALGVLPRSLYTKHKPWEDRYEK